MIKLDGDRDSFCLSSRSGKGFRIRVESDHLNVGVKAFKQHRQSAGTTANVKHTVPRPNQGLIEKRSPGAITAEQLHPAGRKAAASKRGLPREDRFSEFLPSFQLLLCAAK